MLSNNLLSVAAATLALFVTSSAALPQQQTRQNDLPEGNGNGSGNSGQAPPGVPSAGHLATPPPGAPGGPYSPPPANPPDVSHELPEPTPPAGEPRGSISVRIFRGGGCAGEQLMHPVSWSPSGPGSTCLVYHPADRAGSLAAWGNPKCTLKRYTNSYCNGPGVAMDSPEPSQVQAKCRTVPFQSILMDCTHVPE